MVLAHWTHVSRRPATWRPCLVVARPGALTWGRCAGVKNYPAADDSALVPAMSAVPVVSAVPDGANGTARMVPSVPVVSGGLAASPATVRTPRPAVQAEIDVLPPVHAPEFVAVAQRLQERESLVWAIRAMIRHGDAAGTETLQQVLIDQSQPLIHRIARSQSLPSPQDWEDVVQEATVRMWREVRNTSRSEEFWEINFTHMIITACRDAAAALRRKRRLDRPFHQTENADGDVWDEATTIADPEAMDVDLFVPEALGQLDGPIRLTMSMLVLGFKEHSQNPEEMTISRALNVSDRTVRTYRRKGAAIIRAWYGGQLPAQENHR